MTLYPRGGFANKISFRTAVGITTVGPNPTPPVQLTLESIT
ncbi:MAG: hypothetical protein QXV17_06565 [Candidatus Micrarchaeaceae archaeon]